MTVFTEGRHATEGLLYEDEAGFSRDNLTIAEGSPAIVPGAVLGKITVGEATSAAKSGGNTGTGTLVVDATDPIGAGAKPGVYTLRFVTATTFRLNDPNGDSLGTYAIGGSNGNAVTISSEIKFALTQASTVFVIGDGFDITVGAGHGEYALSPATIDQDFPGAEVACAIALYAADPTDAVVKIAGITRHAQFKVDVLSYDTTVNDDTKKAAKIAELATRGIIAR